MSAAGSGLALRLREATAAQHRQAERSRFMAALIAGRADHRSYRLLLHNLLPIYGALEPLLQAHREHAWLAPVWAPAMARLPALQNDIAEWQRLAPSDLGPPLPASVHYAHRLNSLLLDTTSLDTAIARLLGHAYVRYLGDLSGGQVLQRVVARQLGLSGASGTTFYDFGAPDQAAALLQRWRQTLAALPAEGALADAAVQEACWSFDQHLRLFEALEAFMPAQPIIPR